MGIEILPGEMPRIERPGGVISHAVRVRNTGEAGSDVVELDLVAGAWSTALVEPSPIALGACHSTTISVQVTVPPTIGWHVYDTATLTVRSTVSPGLTATASLVSKSPAPVLLVDGSRFYDVGEPYRNALGGAGIGYDEHRIKGVWPVAIPTSEMLSTYPMVVWYTAYDWYEALSALEEARLVAYLDGGGRLLLSSQDYLYSRDADSLFARDYLGVFGYNEGVETAKVWGETSHPIGWGLGPYTLTYSYPNWSDGLIPADGAQTVFRGEYNLPAAIAQQKDGWRTSFAAFPFEALDAGAAETAIDRSVGWLSWLGGSTWQADRRNVTGNSVVTMTGILRNDGWADVAVARFSATVPAGLSFVAGSLSPSATYHDPTRTVSWQGSLARNETTAVSFSVQVGSLPPLTQVSFPAQLGYDDHHLDFERPCILRIDAPDLSGSSLTVEPISSPVGRILTYTLTVRNDGVVDATAEVSATAPYQAAFTGTLDSGGIGSGDVVSSVLSWAGPVPAGGQVTLRYHLAPDDSSDYWLFHLAQVRDQTGERWYPEARAYVWSWKIYMPKAAKRGSP